MTEEMKKKLQTTERRMMMIIQTERKAGTCPAAAHAASVDVELHDPNMEPEDDTTEQNRQDLNEHEESSHDADSNAFFDEISHDTPENEQEPSTA